MRLPDRRGYYGHYGGRFVPELLMPALMELELAYRKLKKSGEFKKELRCLLKDFVGRPTPLYHAKALSKSWGAEIFLKREDLAYTGAHKINNTIGQALLAKRMGKKRIIAETGAGQHGVAVATACALLGLQCVVYMGRLDMERQTTNVFKMRLLGADVIPVEKGSCTLKDAINEAMRDWATHIDTTHYLIGSVVGPHPYPMIVRDFQCIIGKECLAQLKRSQKGVPDALIACVGGGSNSIGLFHPFLAHPHIKMYGVEAGGKRGERGNHSMTLSQGRPGILHGALSYLLHDQWGQILTTHSIAPGLDYPGVGPEHAYLKDAGRVKYVAVDDKQAYEAFLELSEKEGIIPALESSHALAFAKRLANEMEGSMLLVNLSGRGDKDLGIVTGSEMERV